MSWPRSEFLLGWLALELMYVGALLSRGFVGWLVLAVCGGFYAGMCRRDYRLYGQSWWRRDRIAD